MTSQNPPPGEPDGEEAPLSAEEFLDLLEPDVKGLIVAQEGNADEEVVEMIAAGWGVELPAKLIGGKRVRTMTMPLDLRQFEATPHNAPLIAEAVRARRAAADTYAAWLKTHTVLTALLMALQVPQPAPTGSSDEQH